MSNTVLIEIPLETSTTTVTTSTTTTTTTTATNDDDDEYYDDDEDEYEGYNDADYYYQYPDQVYPTEELLKDPNFMHPELSMHFDFFNEKWIENDLICF